MKRKFLSIFRITLPGVVLLAFLFLAACGASSPAEPAADLTPEGVSPAVTTEMDDQDESSSQAPVSDQPGTEDGLPPPPEFAAQPLKAAKDDLFANAGVCTACHIIVKDSAGRDVSMETHWRSSIKAQAARDPYFLATVRSEVDEFPALREVIEDKCASCHMPMATTSIHLEGGKAAMLDDGLLNPSSERHALAIEGVSCNLCHQVESTNFGDASSFSGGYVINPQPPMGERPAYGKFDVDQGSISTMSGASGYIPMKSEHVQQSELCATCHNLYTPFLDENGEIAGEFPEQMVYSEWKNSSFQATTSCQACHMPVIPGGLPISILSTPPRDPYHQHLFHGGNLYMLRIYQYYGEELGLTASSDQLKTTLNATQDLLETETAQVVVENAVISEGVLEAEIVLKNLAGHKFPTSYPSRRAWLHIQVRDAGDLLVFESGGYGTDGKILENDNDQDASLFEPHYQAITAADQVQIYESIMGDTQDQVTTTLLKGAQYLKDNRLLPAGFIDAVQDIRPDNLALQDEDFVAGEDRVRLRIELGSLESPLTLSVRVLFQSIGYRWAQNLAGFPSEEVSRFMNYYETIPNTPVVTAEYSVEIK